MSVKDAVIRAAVVKTIKDLVAHEELVAKCEVMGELDPGDRKGAILPDGTDIGTVSYSRGSAGADGWAVTDVAALTAWAQEHRPDAVQQVTVLAEWFTAPANVRALAESGEVPDGIAPVTGTGSSPSISVRQTAGQKAAALAALSSGQIDARLALMLDGGTS